MNSQTAPKVGAYDYKNSIVAKDMIWKDYVNKANQQAKHWPNQWGFLNGKLEDVVYNEKRSNPTEHSNLVPTNSIDSPRSLPKTTSGMIGWKSTNTVNALEKFGPYTRGRQTITKSLKWPREGVN